ncbi:M15 family metallopeptidase [Glacieibacterium frigidum]|uniref:D-alanyl-D-alanine carboxypeptidase-like core domain-containing protein n=1 Tax=Glacieibacterium frigidum TaxID=2593303 RepID=A0A552UIE8_9SPHN|nr:M15 family metallopeptidase [Glacieibacterium frigidum]TRW17995.1 hypothetical protein FMM06_07735 [Glacieibacterium frigidum]
MASESYLGRPFTVDNDDALLRVGTALDTFVVGANGRPRSIPNGSKVEVRTVKAVPTGAKSVSLFVEVADTAGALIGWTSAGNLHGKFLSETLGEIPPPNGNRFGPNAAWSKGVFLGQVTLVRVVGTKGELEFIARDSSAPFVALCTAARAAGRSIGLNSGFRTFAEQQHLFDGHKRGLAGFNLAAAPGKSNHQSGIAFDLDVKPGDGNRDYEWLKGNATAHGFIRTVSSEPWHWEFLPAKAAAARQRGVFGTFM